MSANLKKVAWMKEAACKDSDPTLFLSHEMEKILEAKKICAGCTVAFPCLVSYWEVDCVAGGLSRYERMVIQWKGTDKAHGSIWRAVDEVLPKMRPRTP